MRFPIKGPGGGVNELTCPRSPVGCRASIIIMKSLALILCLSAAAAAVTLASPVETEEEDCSDCVNHCKTLKRIKYVEEFETKCHLETQSVLLPDPSDGRKALKAHF